MCDDLIMIRLVPSPHASTPVLLCGAVHSEFDVDGIASVAVVLISRQVIAQMGA